MAVDEDGRATTKERERVGTDAESGEERGSGDEAPGTKARAGAAGDRTARDVAREAEGRQARKERDDTVEEEVSPPAPGAAPPAPVPGTTRIPDEELDAPLEVAGRALRSRLIVGTGKYADSRMMVDAIRASGADMVTVAVRRVDLDRSASSDAILDHLDPDEFFLLPNTAGCYTAEEAVRYARLARAAGFNEYLKLEVIGDEDTLLPDVEETLEAARTLTDEGFKVMAYTNDDVVTALKLEDAGCVAVMPLASPIGSGLGVVNPFFIREIKRRLEVPVIVDAGVGTASDACVTMEQGVDGVLMNSALAYAEDPVAMARAMRHAVRAGRLAYLAGRMATREIAVPSSPTRGMLD